MLVALSARSKAPESAVHPRQIPSKPDLEPDQTQVLFDSLHTFENAKLSLKAFGQGPGLRSVAISLPP